VWTAMERPWFDRFMWLSALVLGPLLDQAFGEADPARPEFRCLGPLPRPLSRACPARSARNVDLDHVLRSGQPGPPGGGARAHPSTARARPAFQARFTDLAPCVPVVSVWTRSSRRIVASGGSTFYIVAANPPRRGSHHDQLHHQTLHGGSGSITAEGSGCCRLTVGLLWQYLINMLSPSKKAPAPEPAAEPAPAAPTEVEEMIIDPPAPAPAEPAEPEASGKKRARGKKTATETAPPEVVRESHDELNTLQRLV
jgi:hypothetical protein